MSVVQVMLLLIHGALHDIILIDLYSFLIVIIDRG